MSMYFGFFAWNAGLALGGVARVGQVQLLQPFLSLALAATLLGEPIDAETAIAAALVAAIVLAGRRTRIAPARRTASA
jgi:drug/metabolite transporter (DMT)-like permease